MLGRGRRERDDLPRATFGQGAQMIGPTRERRTNLTFIDRAIVNAGRAAFVPALVIEYLLDDVRSNADVGHAGRDTAA